MTEGLRGTAIKGKWKEVRKNTSTRKQGRCGGKLAIDGAVTAKGGSLIPGTTKRVTDRGGGPV